MTFLLIGVIVHVSTCAGRQIPLPICKRRFPKTPKLLGNSAVDDMVHHTTKYTLKPVLSPHCTNPSPGASHSFHASRVSCIIWCFPCPPRPPATQIHYASSPTPLGVPNGIGRSSTRLLDASRCLSLPEGVLGKGKGLLIYCPPIHSALPWNQILTRGTGKFAWQVACTCVDLSGTQLECIIRFACATRI
jgi:hypothetical protein